MLKIQGIRSPFYIPLLLLMLASSCGIRVNSLQSNAVATTPVFSCNPSLFPLNDSFSTTTINSSLWMLGDTTGPAYLSPLVAVTQPNGGLDISVPTNTQKYNGLFTQRTADLTDASVMIQLSQRLGTVAGLETDFYATTLNYHDSFGYYNDGTDLKCFARVNSISTMIATVPYDGVAQKFIRYRHQSSDDTLYCDVSPDGFTWTNLGSLVRPALLPLSALYITIQAGAYINAPAASAEFGNFCSNAVLN